MRHQGERAVEQTLANSAAPLQSGDDAVVIRPEGSVKSVKPGRLEFLDALRGFAAILVVVDHYVEQYWPAAFQAMGRFFSLGRFGVVIFFVVSGFVIPLSLERSQSNVRFWISRIFRLYPVYIVAFALFGLLYMGLGGDAARILQLEGNAEFSPQDWVINALLLQFFFQEKMFDMDVPNIMRVSWTLGVEWMIYIGASLLFAVKQLRRDWIVFAVAIGIGFLPALYRPFRVMQSGPFIEPILIWMAFIGLMLYRQKDAYERSRTVLICSTFVLVLLSIFLNQQNGVAELRPRYIMETLSFVGGGLCFYLFFLFREFQFPRMALWLGRISYSLYLIHPLFQALGYRVGVLSATPVLGFILQILASIISSWLCYKYVEAPFISYGQRVYAKISSARKEFGR